MTDINYIINENQNYLNIICEKHEILKKEMMMSPCRGVCVNCKAKRIGGYSNPDHVTNSFGYLYLIPNYCIKCSCMLNKCMWCE